MLNKKTIDLRSQVFSSPYWYLNFRCMTYLIKTSMKLLEDLHSLAVDLLFCLLDL